MLASTPKAWWRFSEPSGSVVHDSTTGGHDATIAPNSGEASLGWRGVGATGTSLRLTGDGAVILPASTVADVSAVTYSVECWVYVARLPARARCMSMGVAGTNGFDFGVGDGTTPSSDVVFRYGVSSRNVTGTNAVAPGWNHLAAVVSNGQIAVYANGTLRATKQNYSWQNNYVVPSTPGQIGPASPTARIDEVAHYKRSLSASEAADHAAAGRGTGAPISGVSTQRVQSAAGNVGYGVRLNWAPYTAFTPDGYRILRDGEVVDSITAGNTWYLADDPTMTGGWSIVAYAGSVESPEASFGDIAPRFRANVASNWDPIALGSGRLVGASADFSRVVYWSPEALTGEPQTTGRGHLYVQNRQTGQLRRLSGVGGAELDVAGPSVAEVSADGSFVVFISAATNLTSGDTNGVSDAFRWNTTTGAVVRVTAELASTGGGIWAARISADGSQVTFATPRALPGAGGCGSVNYNLFAWQSPPSGTPFITKVSAAFTTNQCPSDITGLSPSGQFVVVKGDNWQWWLVDRDSDNNGKFDDAGGIGLTMIPGADGAAPFAGSGAVYDAAIAELPGGAVDIAMHTRTHNPGCADCVLVYRKGESASRIISQTQGVVSGELDISTSGRYILYTKGTGPMAGSYPATLGAFRADRDSDGNGIYDEPGTITHTPLHYYQALATPSKSNLYRLKISDTGRYALAEARDEQLLGLEDTPDTVDAVIWDLDAGKPSPQPYRNTPAYAATQGHIADPIVASTGNFTHREPLLQFPAHAAALDLTATYNHQDPGIGGLGTSWVLSTDTRLVELDAGPETALDLRTENGDHVLYHEGAGSTWETTTAGDSTVIVDVSGGRERRHVDGAVERFDSDGWWMGTEFSDGSSLEVTRDGTGRATRVEHSTGYGYDLTWAGGRIMALEADDGRENTFSYTDGDLTAITREDGQTTAFTLDARGRVQAITEASGRGQSGPGYTLAANLPATGSFSAGNWTPSRTSLTAEVWASTSTAAPGGSNGQTLIAKHGTSTTGEFALSLLDNGKLRFTTRASTISVNNYDVPVTWTANTPHHVVATWDGTTKRLYLDGTQVGSGQAWTGTLATTTSNLTLSGSAAGLTAPFNGTLDEVALYPTALSGTRVGEHYRLGTAAAIGESYTDDGPLTDGATAYWRMAGPANEVSGAPAMVRSGAPASQPFTLGLLRDSIERRSVLTNTYDLSNRATSQTNASGARTSINYDDAPSSPDRPRVTETLDEATGDVTRMEMLANGTVAQVTGADGITRARTVSNGQLSGLSEAGVAQTFARDPLTGAVTQWVRPDATNVDITYDNVDRPTAITVGGVETLAFTYGLDDTETGARRDRHPVSFTGPDSDTTTLTYSTVGGAERLTSMTDPDGVETTFSYNTKGHLETLVVDPSGEELTTSWTYDAPGRVATITLPGGAVWSYTYDAVGRPLTVTDPASKVATTAYTPLGDISTVTDRAWATTTFTWRADGLLDSETDPDGVVTSYGYNANGEVTSITNAAGTTNLELGPMQRVDAVIDPTGRRVELTYDHAGRVLTRTSIGDAGTSADDLLETWTYNPGGQVLSYTDATGATTTNMYDGFGRLVTTVDPTGVTSETTYDASGRVLTNTAGGAETAFTWSDAGRLETVTDADGVERFFTYDTAGRQVGIDDAGVDTAITYGSDGQVASYTHAGVTTELTRDLLGQVTATSGPAGASASTFDDEGRVLTHTLSPGTADESTWTYGYTAAGRLAAVTDPIGGTSVLAYDAAGRQTLHENGSDIASWVNLDASGRVTSRYATASGWTTYDHDAHGRTVGTTDASGRTTELTLDGAGRTLLRHSTAAGLPDVDDAYTYDAAGRPLTVVDSGGTSTWTWDTTPAVLPTDPAPTGRLLTRTDPNGALTYGWTDAGRMASRTVAPATGPPQVESYGYTDGRLTGRTGPTGTSTYSWTDGRLAATTHPAGSSVRTYDTAGRLETLTNDDGTTETSYELGYDTQGRVVTNTRTVDGDPLTAATTAWSYDPASQLTSETHTGATSAPDRTWTWTGGRLQSQTVGDQTKDTGWVDGRMTQVAIDPSALPGDEELVSFTYDDAGRQTAWSSPDVNVSRSFDAAGRLTGATRTEVPGTTTEARTYHAGQLVAASVDDGTTDQTHSLWWDDGDLVPNAATIVDPVAGPLTQLVGELAPGAPTWILTELGPLTGGAGGPNAPPPQLTDPFGGGSALGTSPFGELDTPATAPVQATTRGALAIGISGVSLTGPAPLVHTGARDADAELFISPDPLTALAGTPDASNSYAAHGNSPTTVWDFSGLRPNYGDDGSRFGMVGTLLQAASMVPGLDTFADGALCALELGAAIGGNGDTASLVMSCAAVVLPAVGAGAMVLTSRAYKGVTEIRKARNAVRVAEEVLEEGLEHGDEVAGVARRGLSTFRGDARAPSVVFDEGFRPKGTNTDLWEHAKFNPPDSAFVSTSTSPAVASRFPTDPAPYVYEVRASGGIDVNAALGTTSPFDHELEIAYEGGIRACDIVGCRSASGEWIPNPNHRA